MIAFHHKDNDQGYRDAETIDKMISKFLKNKPIHKHPWYWLAFCRYDKDRILIMDLIDKAAEFYSRSKDTGE